MSQVIRAGLVAAAVATLIALLVPFSEQVVTGIGSFAEAFTPIISQMTGFLVFGRKMLNLLVGYPELVDIMLWFALLAPLALHAVGFVMKITKKIIG